MKKILPILLLCLFACQGLPAQKTSEPERTFLQFWKIMDKQYAFFALHEVDWDEVKRTYGPKITAETTEEELFGFLSEILARFQDAHISLKSNDEAKRRFSGGRPSHFDGEFSTDSLKRAYFANVQRSLKEMGFGTTRHKGPILSEKKAVYDHTPFEYAESPRWGYIKISWMFYNWQKLNLLSIPADRRKFLRAFDEILAEFAQKKGLIIDLRNNIGGMTGHPEGITRRFTDTKHIGEYHQRRKRKDHESFTKMKAVKVKAAQNAPWNRPVVVLCNDKTVSAAEELLTMLGQLEQVTVVGVPSQGALSDVKGRTLPNGWKLEFSNMRFYDSDRVCHEGRGLPVDVEVENGLSDLEKSDDPVLRKAVEILEDKARLDGSLSHE